MDSRIRELEQWLAEAKRDLGECGQEAYLQKLYLLDAEIRAVIKANGAQTGMDSPSPAGRPVRGQTPARQGGPASMRLALTLGVSGVALLAAATVATRLPALQGGSGLLARLSGGRSTYIANSGQPETGLDLSRAGQSSTTPPAGFIPASIPGEEILPVGWTPAMEELADVTLFADAQPATQPGSILAGSVVETRSAPARMGERPNQSGLSRGDIQTIMAMQPVSLGRESSAPRENGAAEADKPASIFDANQATDVVLASVSVGPSSGGKATGSGTGKTASKPKGAGTSSPGVAIYGDVPLSSGGGLGDHSIGRWNFDQSNFLVPAEYKPVSDTSALKNNKRSKKNKKQKTQSADGAKSAETARETRPGEAEEIRVAPADSGSPQGNEHGGEGAES